MSTEFLQLFSYFVHCSFCFRHLHCFTNRNRFVNQIVEIYGDMTFFQHCGFDAFQHYFLLRELCEFQSQHLNRIWSVEY